MNKNKIEINLGDSRYLAIDLTQPLKLDTEVYPGDPKPEREVFSSIETGWRHYVHRLGDHNFQPHGDAPNHQDPGTEKGFDSFGPEYCFNKACMIDLSGEGKEVDGVRYVTEVRKEHLEQFSEKIKEMKAVIIRTGYDKWLEDNRPHAPENLPYLNREAAEFIASFEKIRVIGIDSLTVDPPGRHDSHHILKDRLIVESLVHLYEIPAEARDGFDLQTIPVRIEGATGGPVVAYAFIGL